MDFNWAPYFTFWIFPLLCFVFMALMMIACGGMFLRGRHRAHSRDAGETTRQILDRRYASGEIAKEASGGVGAASSDPH